MRASGATSLVLAATTRPIPPSTLQLLVTTTGGAGRGPLHDPPPHPRQHRVRRQREGEGQREVVPVAHPLHPAPRHRPRQRPAQVEERREQRVLRRRLLL